MKIRGLGLVILVLVVAAIGTNALANFEPLFRVIKVTGECTVKLPDGDAFVPAEESKAYPYGTAVRTGMRSSLVIIFSEGNLCRVLANANLTMSEGISNKKLKIIRLNEGEVEVELLEDFHTDGNALNVETATAICGAIGCKFRVASKTEADLRIIIVRVIEGLIRIHGENFAATELAKDDWLSLLSPPDRSFLRLKTMKGEFDITIKDEDGNDRNVPTEEGTVLKIWQREVPGTDQRVVVAELTGPDGRLIETVTVTYDPDESPSFPGQGPDDPDWDGDDADKPGQGQRGPRRPRGPRPRPRPPQHYDPSEPDSDPGQEQGSGRRPPRPGGGDTTPTPVGKRY
ncbi:MAG: hypothetical protein HN341_03630 [Verrucomicrobia bacterium]|jgi:hypothetical protein|nr:hypothetical protein [Verrucomicrobiota bacterium]